MRHRMPFDLEPLPAAGRAAPLFAMETLGLLRMKR